MKAKGGGILERDAYARLTDAEIDAILEGAAEPPPLVLHGIPVANPYATPRERYRCSRCKRRGHNSRACTGRS